MAEWIISDTHWYHQNILTYDWRPFGTMGQMLDHMIKVWIERVDPKDTVYHLGDVAMVAGGRDVYIELVSEIMGWLPGRKVLIQGNHDRKASDMLAVGFDEVHKWLELNRDGKTIYMTHKPWDKDKHLLGPDCELILHGHVHTAWHCIKRGDRTYYNAGCMWTPDYGPEPLDAALRA